MQLASLETLESHIEIQGKGQEKDGFKSNALTVTTILGTWESTSQKITSIVGFVIKAVYQRPLCTN